MSTVPIILALVLLCASTEAASDGERINPSDFARRVLATTDLVLKRHIDPPPRQAMLTEAVRSLWKKAGQPTPIGLGRRVSEVATEEQANHFLSNAWTDAHPSSSASDEQLLAAAIEGVFLALPEKPGVIPPKEAKVQEQVRGNRYVGIGIQLGMHQEDNDAVPVIINPFPRGPARLAGAKPGDRILEIDGVSTNGMTLEAVVSRLRGDEGSQVTLIVQTDRDDVKRTLQMTRGVVPFQSFNGYRRVSEDEWQYRPNESEPIGYLQLTGILPSTLSELRRLAPTLESQGIRALVLDLRTVGGAGNDIQHVVLLADELLEEGAVGRLTDTSGSTREFQSGSDCLFRTWPMVVLVNQYTRGDAEFLAAALQDNQRAVIVGERTHGSTFVQTPVELPDGLGSVMLRTGLMSRADGRPLHREKSAPEGIDEVQVRPTQVPAAGHEDQCGDWGVGPDHVVSLTPEQFKDSFAWRAQQGLAEPPATGRIPAPPDPQLDKAMEILRGTVRITAPE